ncbi:MAG TPA: GAF domain-containing protein [Candidatus Polarisedimenticolia bacterium]|nr:GAF domain-containing protein [Candidatus Polarisedimenticolia bacterium]
MDHDSILDHSSSSSTTRAENSSSANGLAIPGVSARLAAANTVLPDPSQPSSRFPGEDAGRSLAEMAANDLDATLQLLVERAQYITGASGGAIALRRGEQNDMVCRASTGSNAPQLGALLSTEYGLSGECVRTRQPLRCDDAERDPRVNRDVCRELGIASVVVMPIVGGDQVLGVFELLSGKPRAFDERDLSALLRLGEMVQSSVQHAVGAKFLPVQTAVAEIGPQVDIAAEVPSHGTDSPTTLAAPVPIPPIPEIPPADEKKSDKKKEAALPVPAKALFWSAAIRADANGQPKKSTEAIAVPPVLRNLQKCQACGFPVSQGRAFCVECEEKHWRGQRPAQSPSSQKPNQLSSPETGKSASVVKQGTFIQDSPSDRSPIPTPPAANGKLAGSVPEPQVAEPQVTEPQVTQTPQESTPITATTVEAAIATQGLTALSPSVGPADVLASDGAPFLSGVLQSESWFATNKYILGALLVVAITIAAIAYLR